MFFLLYLSLKVNLRSFSSFLWQGENSMSAGFSRPGLAGLIALSMGMTLALGACGGDHHGHAQAKAPIPVASPTPNPAVASACVASGAMGIDVNSANGQVSVYAPAGDWGTSTTGVFLVPVEAGGVIGTGVTRATVATAHAVNSCSVNSATGIVICSANNTDAYLINRSTLTAFTLTSAGNGTQSFTGGSCTNCNAIADPVTDLGIVGISLASGNSAGYQFFSLSTGVSQGVVTVPGSVGGSLLSESPAIEPTKHLLLSANEDQDFQIINFSGAGVFRYAQRATVLADTDLDGAAVDCTTDIALAADEFNNQVFITDLTQVTFTPGSGGSPGTWDGPAQLQKTPQLQGITTTGLAVAPSGHVGIMQEEFGGNNFAAFSLPATSGSGTPALTDWVAAKVPTQPDTNSWNNTLDPHGLTAYTSPTTNIPMGVLLNGPRTFIAVVDLNKLLAAPRTLSHTVDPTYNLVANGVLTFVSVH